MTSTTKLLCYLLHAISHVSHFASSRLSVSCWFGERCDSYSFGSLWNLMYFHLCLQTERQREEEPTKPFSHQVRLSRKRQPSQKDKYDAEQVRQNPLISCSGVVVFDKHYSFLTSASSTLGHSLHTIQKHATETFLWIQNIFFAASSGQSWPRLWFFLSISPEAALQWSDSFEELLKHSGQFNATNFSSVCHIAVHNSSCCCQTICSIWIQSCSGSREWIVNVETSESFTTSFNLC